MDHALTMALYGGDAVNGWTRVMLALSFIGGGWALVAWIPLIAMRRTRAGALALLAAILVQVVLVGALKGIVRRVRPYIVLGWHPAYVPPHDYSFPSGHSAGSFTVAAFLVTTLMHTAPARGRVVASVLLLALAGAIASSRVYLGVHWVGDVVGGAAIGGAIGWYAARLFARLRPR